jgi:DNA-binding NarL/FixJ family response regulator
VATVLLVDSSAAMRRALRESLLEEPGVCVVGEAGSLRQALSVAKQVQPDIVLLDAEMADLDPAAAIRVLRERVPTSALIVVTIEPDRFADLVREVGGVDAVGKVDGPTALLAAVRRVVRRASDPG